MFWIKQVITLSLVVIFFSSCYNINDPNQGGFWGGVYGDLLTDTYNKRLEEREAHLKKLKQKRQQLEAEHTKKQRYKAELEAEIARISHKARLLSVQLSQLSSNDSSTQLKKAQLSQGIDGLNINLIQLKQTLTVEKSEKLLPVDLYKEKVAQLSQEVRQLREVLNYLVSKEAITIERYPTIECRDEVRAAQEFPVQISLTEDLITPKTSSKQSYNAIKTDKNKQFIGDYQLLKLNKKWEIEVVLSAPAFSIQGSDSSTIILPSNGDSTVALFHLTPKPIKEANKIQKIYATLWHQGEYLARIMRDITVNNIPRNILQVSPIIHNTKQKRRIVLGLQSPKMMVYIRHHLDYGSNNSRMFISSKHLNRRYVDSFLIPVDLSKWLKNNYAYFTRASENMITLASEGQSTQSEKERNIALLKGFGRQLYEQFAPQEFKNAFWALKDKLGDEFDTIHIFTDDPLMPWELMIPSRANEELDFLGIDFQIARWHISENPAQLDRPSQSLNMQKLLAIVPDYPDDPLSAVSNELEVLQNISGFRRVSGRYAALSHLFKNAETDNSLIHFSGHGIVQKTRRGLSRYAIKLEDGKLDLMTWRGLMPRHHQTHPFFFFNACDVGQAHHVANFVDGWAPAVLEAGASGYIGGLWPLVNKGATAFAELFYQQLEAILKAERPANVADLLRKTRKRFYENGDPTFLGYVYYGDPHFQLVRE